MNKINEMQDQIKARIADVKRRLTALDIERDTISEELIALELLEEKYASDYYRVLSDELNMTEGILPSHKRKRGNYRADIANIIDQMNPGYMFSLADLHILTDNKVPNSSLYSYASDAVKSGILERKGRGLYCRTTQPIVK